MYRRPAIRDGYAERCQPPGRFRRSKNPTGRAARWPAEADRRRRPGLILRQPQWPQQISVSLSYAPRSLAQRRVSIRSPNRTGEIDHKPELCLLRFKGDGVPGFDAGEAALRTDAKAIEIDETAGVDHAALEVLDGLDRGRLGRYQAEDDGLVFRHEPQRREI